MGSSRKRSSSKTSEAAAQDNSDNDEPEEIQANSEELAALRAAFEQYTAGGGGGGGDDEEDEKTRKRRKLREKKSRARAQLDASQGHQKLDPSVLHGLNADALQEQSITITNEDDNDDIEVVENDDGFRINRNTRSSVRLVEGNMEVHVLGETRSNDIIASFLPGSSESIIGKSVAMTDLLEARERTGYRVFSAQKKGGPSKTFAKNTDQNKKKSTNIDKKKKKLVKMLK